MDCQMTALPDAMIKVDRRVDEIQIQLSELCRSSLEAAKRKPLDVAMEIGVLPSHLARLCDPQSALRLGFGEAVDLAFKLGFDLELQIEATKSGLAVFRGAPLRRSKFATHRMMMTELRTEAFSGLNEVLRRAGREMSSIIDDLRMIDGSSSASGTATKTQPSAEIALAYLSACGLDVDITARTYESESAARPALIEAPDLPQIAPTTNSRTSETRSGSVPLTFRVEAPQSPMPSVDPAEVKAELEAAKVEVDQAFSAAQERMSEAFQARLQERGWDAPKAAKAIKEDVATVEQMMSFKKVHSLTFARCLDLCMAIGLDIEFQPLILHRKRPLDVGQSLRRSQFEDGKAMLQQARVECGQALREYLEVTGLTGSLYAEQLGMAASTVSGMMSPKPSRNVTIQKLLTTLKAKGCKVQIRILPRVLESASKRSR
jgi:predicted XRE-type DNA-binding protein